eukprot:1991848-Amphidinium_carterae.1
MVLCWVLDYFHNHASTHHDMGTVRWSLYWSQQGYWQQNKIAGQEGTRVALRLPTRGQDGVLWFSRLLKARSESLDTDARLLRTSKAIRLRLLIDVSPDVLYESALTQLNHEQKLLWDFYKWPADAAFLRVNAVYHVETLAGDVFVSHKLGARDR